MVKWNEILKNSAMKNATVDFATGNLAKNDFHQFASQHGVGGPVRQLVRKNGATYSRRLARKALKRRSILV